MESKNESRAGMIEITFTETEDSPGFVHILAETKHNGERIGCVAVMPNGTQQQIKKELRRTLLEHVTRCDLVL